MPLDAAPENDAAPGWTHTFPVGAAHFCTLTIIHIVDHPSSTPAYLTIHWSPEMPVSLSREALQQYMHGRAVAGAYASERGLTIQTIHVTQGILD